MTLPERFDIEPDSPVVEITLVNLGEEGLNLNLKWHDTTVRIFSIGDGEYDHIVHVNDDGSWTAIKTSDEVKQQLVDLDFPRTYSPILDEDALMCLAACQMAQLEEDMKDAGSGLDLRED